MTERRRSTLSGTGSVCPACENEFPTVRGMRVHHTKVHGTPLPNRTCSSCNDPFYDPDGARVYCDECKPPRSGEPRWKHGNTEASCVECGATFLYYPSEKRGLYCPACVQDDDVRCKPPDTGDKSGRSTVSCAQCRAPLSVHAYKAAAQDHHYCDRDCYAAWLGRARREEGVWAESDNPNWHDGGDRDQRYGAGWPSARNRALDRDEYTCQRCGASRSVLGRNPDVHHVEPVRTFDDPADAHTLDNLVCLCRTCHLEVERFGGHSP